MLAYFDCFSGISGDMTLGALISSGVPVEWLEGELNKLPAADIELSVAPVMRSGISALKVDVYSPEGHVSRNYGDIRTLIEKSPLEARVKQRSLSVFETLAAAEGAIHGCSMEKVHFHEVGGIDAIADIVGVSLCLEYLGIHKIVSSKIPLGSGFVHCSHGTLPVPAPATAAILKDVPVCGADIDGELVTPTGAAIITTLADSFGTLPDMVIEKIGYGAGSRVFENRPNLLRIMLGRPIRRETHAECGAREETVGVVETCVDDMNPECLGFLMERLYDDGALEVYLIPVFTKKNRPATMIQVLCRLEEIDRIMQRVLMESTSLGVRHHAHQRLTLAREPVTAKTPFGDIQVKQITDLNGVKRIVPEYEVCRKIALEKNIPLKRVYASIIKTTAADGADGGDTLRQDAGNR